MKNVHGLALRPAAAPDFFGTMFSRGWSGMTGVTKAVEEMPPVPTLNILPGNFTVLIALVGSSGGNATCGRLREGFDGKRKSLGRNFAAISTAWCRFLKGPRLSLNLTLHSSSP